MLRFAVDRCTVVFLIFYISLSDTLFAQREPLSSMWWKNITTLNPAYSGSNYKHFANIQYRDQWTEVKDNPQTLWMSYDMKADFLHGGLGINYTRDNIGFFKRDRVLLNYSYHLSLNDKHKLNFGISAGIGIHTLDYSKIVANNDPSIDPAIPPNDDDAETVNNLNLGVRYSIKEFQLGFAVNNLLEPAIIFTDFGRFEYETEMHYYVTTSYLLKATTNISIQPQFIFRSMRQNNTNSYDLNLRTIFKETAWAGVSYRNEDWWAFMAGVTMSKKLQLAYSYDKYQAEKFSAGLGPTHELSMSVIFK